MLPTPLHAAHTWWLPGCVNVLPHAPFTFGSHILAYGLNTKTMLAAHCVTCAPASTCSMMSLHLTSPPSPSGRVSAMELDTLSPNMTQLLMDMGAQYDPDRLAEALQAEWPQV